jgi:hypothetical protein
MIGRWRLGQENRQTARALSLSWPGRPGQTRLHPIALASEKAAAGRFRQERRDCRGEEKELRVRSRSRSSLESIYS